MFTRVWLVTIIFLAATAFARVGHSTPEDACALTVTVSGPSGEPIGSTMVELLDASGRTVLRQLMKGPTLTICDFGFGKHTLRVGTNECFPLAISNLTVDLGHPIYLSVRLNACNGGDGGSNACRLYFRVTDSNGRPLRDVALLPEFTVPPLHTDSYGRIQTSFIGKREIILSKPGFVPKSVAIECAGAEEIDREIALQSRE